MSVSLCVVNGMVQQMQSGDILDLIGDLDLKTFKIYTSGSNQTICIAPSGTGAFKLTTAGNARGNYSADLQIYNFDATEIVSGSYAFAAGARNKVSGSYAGALGLSNTSSGYYSFTVGCQNTASQFYSIAFGYQSVASMPAQFALASGRFGAFGDAQASTLVLLKQTTDATPAQLVFGTSPYNITIGDNSTWYFRVSVVARRTDVKGESAAWTFDGCVERNSGTTAIVGSVIKTVIAKDTAAWEVDVGASDATDILTITVTGEAAKTIRWVARVELTQVTG